MAQKKKISINFGSIIMLIIFWNLFFGGEDEKSNEVTVVKQNKPAIEESYPDIKKNLKVLVDDAKNVAIQVKDEIKKELNEKKKGEETEEPKKDEGTILQAESEKQDNNRPDPRPLNTEPEKETKTFKKL
jgi:hypothetical protein